MSTKPGKAAELTGSEKAAERAAYVPFKASYPVAALLSLMGLADALYLTIEHVTGASVRCTITSGCEEVLGSIYSSIAGYPLAGFGALAYFIVFCLATLIGFGYRSLQNLFAAVIGLMAVTTLWLIYVQAFILHHFCQYCLLSAAIILLLSIIAAGEVNRARRY